MKKIEDMSTEELLNLLEDVDNLIEQEKIRQALASQANVTAFGMLGSLFGLLGRNRQRPQTVQVINNNDKVIDAEWRYLEDGR